MTPVQYFGLFLLSLPFIGLAIFTITELGFWEALKLWLAVAALIVCLGLGAYFLRNGL